MKKVLITGKNSYIGTSVEQWLMKEPMSYSVDTIDMKGNDWKQKDFSEYDVVFHVAGIVHSKEKKSNKDVYFKVNRDLAYEVARKAKESQVKQFIFLSTMSVYGIEKGTINRNSAVSPNTFYGRSKIEAENLINSLEDETIVITILRPPMVYGKGCKGNYPKLAKLIQNIPIFPNIENSRSMIYIDNLSEFIKYVIDKKCSGLFFPQNSEYVNTTNMARQIAKIHGKRLILIGGLGILKRFVSFRPLNKLFGDLVYDQKMSESEHEYRIIDFDESIRKTEKI